MDRRSGINTALKSQKSALLGSRSQLAIEQLFFSKFRELIGPFRKAAPKGLATDRFYPGLTCYAMSAVAVRELILVGDMG
jgi:hypothetical protein